ncbi:MAG: DUF4369 domain-containing protein [Flavobacteriaceae bacterium]|jgi:hypothetical protein|nr:DUF4369 domain-containing protein [Flavobacteriaceae bacterium]
MNKYLTILTVLILFIACSSNEDKMTLTGNVKGLKKGTLLLQKIQDSVLVSVDSVLVNGSSLFSFKETILEPEIYYLNVRLENGILKDDRIAFFAEANPINIGTTLTNFTIDAMVTGSNNQEKYKTYKKIIDRYSDRNLELIEQIFEATKQGNDSLANKLDSIQKSILAKKYLATISFALSNKDFEISPYLMVSHVNDAKLVYLDSVYNNLTPKIKDSKYGKDLKSLIGSRKK